MTAFLRNFNKIDGWVNSLQCRVHNPFQPATKCAKTELDPEDLYQHACKNPAKVILWFTNLWNITLISLFWMGKVMIKIEINERYPTLMHQISKLDDETFAWICLDPNITCKKLIPPIRLNVQNEINSELVPKWSVINMACTSIYLATVKRASNNIVHASIRQFVPILNWPHTGTCVHS